MNNNYIFLESKTAKQIYECITPYKVIPEIGQLIKVRYNFYIVEKIKEVLDYDKSLRYITITVRPEN